ncbi:MAG TPA: hypothetical protein VE422_09485 [Terriglobia bacterium]|nr:hypothetical protein [Terriglobia bacterium]
MKTSIRISCLAVILLVGRFTIQGASGPLKRDDPPTAKRHSFGLMSKITLPNGSSRTVRLDGVGCTESICSRVLIKAKTNGNSVIDTWLDSIAAIRDIHENEALFVSKDGSEQRLSFIPDFRVLYIASPGTATEKLDLARIKSLEILGPAK